MKYLYWLICVFALLAAGCSSGSPEDGRLLEISEKVSDSPEEMLARLDSMDVASLGESDRQFHALMRIKAQDKAFVSHTSDSVILRVIDYYSLHPKSGLYPEALYYGGRVYSDIGDAPTALRYFQDALDALPEGKDDEFRATILTQTGWLLNSVRLYNEAARYLDDALTIRSDKADLKKTMYDTQLLGAVYLHAARYDSADSCFRKAREIAVHLSHRDTLIQDMYMAGTELYRGNLSEALERIRGVLGNLPEKNRDIIYAYASQIYLEAGIPDTARLFAIKLIGSDNNDHRRIGYQLLLKPELSRYSDADSLVSYTLVYGELLDEYLNRHDAQQVAMQTSLYNYQTHERERKKAEEAKRVYMYVAGLSLIFILALCIGMLYLRNRRMKFQLDYHKALDNISQLENSLTLTEEKLKKSEKTVEELEAEKLEVEKKLRQAEKKDEIQAEESEDNRSAENDSEEDRVREQLKERLLRLQKAGEARKNDPKEILSASVYARLQENIVNKVGIKIDDEVWIEIEDAVLSVSADFKSKLTLLIGGRIKPDVYHLALLVRCGFGPTDTGALLGRTKGAVSSRRGYICEKIFGEKYGGKVMDDIINLL